MAKYKKLKEHHRFWGKVFEYMKKNQISDPFGLIYYITLTPSNSLNISRALKKALNKYQNLIKDKDLGPETLAVTAVAYTFNYWGQTGKFLKQTDRILEVLYSGIIQDYKTGKPIKYEEITREMYEEAEDLAKTKISSIAWFLISSILENKNVDQVNAILARLQEREEEDTGKLSTLHKESAVIGQMLDNALPEESLLREEYEEVELDEETMLKILNGKIEGNNLILPVQFLKWIIALVRLFLKFNKHYQDLQAQIAKQKKHIEDLYTNFRNEMRLFFEEHNSLIEKLHTLQAQQKLVKIKRESKEPIQVDKYELKIAELKAKIANLQEERNYLNNLIEDLKQQLVPVEEKLESFVRTVKIAYFGLPNPALEQFLAGYNVIMDTYSPINAPTNIPDRPIVFNIDIANHKVYNNIKEHKPFLVSGSNAERLGKLIIEWLKNNNF